MQSWEALPDWPLDGPGTHSRRLRERGARDLRAAGALVHALPYGRNRDRADFGLVLAEGRGTCSTKHALLARAAEEQSCPVALCVGIYDMSERNTPGVGAVLARHGLASLPEAHCYLRYGDDRIDVTRSGSAPEEPIAQLHREWRIEPEQIGAHKQALHRAFLETWLAERADAEALGGLEGIWRVREQCIAVLTQTS